MLPAIVPEKRELDSVTRNFCNTAIGSYNVLRPKYPLDSLVHPQLKAFDTISLALFHLSKFRNPR